MQPQNEADDQYELKSVQSVRGRESNTKAKWQNQGWEFVSERRGTVRTELTFRRVKPKTFGDYLASALTTFRGLKPKTRLALAATGGLILLGGAVGVAIATKSEGGDPAGPAAASATTVSAPARPRTTVAPATPSAEPPIRDVSVSGLVEMLNAGTLKAGGRYRITAELVRPDLWSTGAAGEYNVLVKTPVGSDLEVFVSEAEAKKWQEGTKVEMVLANVEKTIQGETTDGWLEARSTKTLSGGSN